MNEWLVLYMCILSQISHSQGTPSLKEEGGERRENDENLCMYQAMFRLESYL